jgi:hypothetical protein
LDALGQIGLIYDGGVADVIANVYGLFAKKK